MKPCATIDCFNNAVKHRTLCGKCNSSRWRENNPVKAAYVALKTNAKRRGKSFDLTLKDFEEFCVKTDYIAQKGIKKSSFHIDRKDPSKGYTKDNIQVLTNSENVKKYYQYDSVYGHTVITSKEEQIEERNDQSLDDLPF